MGYQEDQRLLGECAPDGEADVPPPAYAPPLPPRSPSAANQDSTNDKETPTPALPSRPTGFLNPLASYQNINHSLQDPSGQHAWSTYDPRNASTESLVPQGSTRNRRTLLLIYVHGFLGDETSFQSFPAHVHNLATQLLLNTHVVYTKIYPRYKSRRAIEFARDDFSNWLRPHESPETDVILLGHSMGGLLIAEVCLKQSEPRNPSPFMHRILGTINFDVPFLGMHPGVVVSGIGSLFRPADPLPAQEQEDTSNEKVLSSMAKEERTLGGSPKNESILTKQSSPGEGSTLHSIASSSAVRSQSDASLPTVSRSMSSLSIPVDDPNFNPRYENDVVLPVRKGWENAMHFITKHSGSLTKAASTYVTSHLEFGGTMADYPGLHHRYRRIRALEDNDDVNHTTSRQNKTPPRVRFVNYYTASTGRSHRPKSPATPLEPRGRQLTSTSPTNLADQARDNVSLNPDAASATASSRSRSPRISVENPEGAIIDETEPDHIEAPIVRDESNIRSSTESMKNLEPEPMDETEGRDELSEKLGSRISPELSGNTTGPHAESLADDRLPPIPPEPIAPEAFDPSAYEDKDVRKLAEKDYARKAKAYNQAVKDREKAIVGRRKMLEKREKRAQKEREKIAKADEKAAIKHAKERAKQEATERKAATQNDGLPGSPSSVSREEAKRRGSETKPKRDRKFCITPSKGPDGQRDPTWVRVFMEGVDEVGAHCGLFFANKPHYEQFVTDIGAKIQEWIERENSIRGRRG